MSDQWIADFHTTHPAFEELSLFNQLFAGACWPDMARLNRLAAELGIPQPHNINDLCIKFVAQKKCWETFADQYEPRIYLTGEVQTRIPGWHDFFQVFIWLLYPQTKAQLNRQHFLHAKERQTSKLSNRTPLENAITLFDECGIVLLSDDLTHLEAVQNHQWSRVFKEKFAISSRLFGHAMYEKFITPYIGMTANAVLLLVDTEVLSWPDIRLRSFIDSQVAQAFADARSGIQSPADLQPFPLLGLPGYWPEQSKSFYQNTQYFRPARKKRGKIIDCRLQHHAD